MRHDEYDDEPYVVIEKHSGSVGSFLVGLALGAGVALLLAPQSGVETRRAVTRRARDAGERARGLADDVRGDVARRVTDARGVVESRVAQARQVVDVRRRQVAAAVEAGRSAAVEARADLERRIAETKAAYQAGSRAARDSIRTPGPAIAGARPVGTASPILDATGAPATPSSAAPASGGEAGGIADV